MNCILITTKELNSGRKNKVFRGYHFEYNGYFNNSAGDCFSLNDINNLMELLGRIMLIIDYIKESPVCNKKELNNIDKKLNKLYNTGMKILNDYQDSLYF